MSHYYYAKREYVCMMNLNISIHVYAELQSCLQGKGPTPSHEIELCFGEEYPDPSIPKTKKLIMAQVCHVYVGKGPRISLCFMLSVPAHSL